MASSQTVKAVILARGLGTRMRKNDDSVKMDAKQSSIADSGMKALIKIDRPFLDYVLSNLADAGYREICLVIGPGYDAIRNRYTKEVKTQRIAVEFAIQEEPNGTADAVLAAEKFAEDNPIVVINSDNYYPLDALQKLRTTDGCAVALFDWESMIDGSNLEKEQLRRFAVASIDQSGCLKQIIEKPNEATWHELPSPPWMSMNCWRFTPHIFEACRSIKPSARGELEIPDAVMYTIHQLGQPFKAITVKSPVLDLTSRQDIAPVAKRLTNKEVCL